MVRVPSLCVAAPSDAEIKRVLWQAPAALATYNLLPSDKHPANAWLYLSTDREYGLAKLSSNMRRDVRRGLREFRIEPISAEQVVTHGVQAAGDTNRRHGLENATQEHFRQVTFRARCPGHSFLGAWKDGQLAAYLAILEVADWVEIRACFSADASLRLLPNHALVYHTLSHYLLDRACHAISFGSSSIQSESNRAGLHAFKTRIGFRAQAVHRAFVLHPLLRPLPARLTLRGVIAALRCMPGDLRLRRAQGVLEYLAGEGQISQALNQNVSDGCEIGSDS